MKTRLMLSASALLLLAGCAQPVVHVTDTVGIAPSSSQPAIDGKLASVCHVPITGERSNARPEYYLKANVFALTQDGYAFVGRYVAPVSRERSGTISIITQASNCTGIAIDTILSQDVENEDTYEVSFKIFASLSFAREAISTGHIAIAGVPHLLTGDEAILSGPDGDQKHEGAIYGWGAATSTFYNGGKAYRVELSVIPGPEFVTTAIRRMADAKVRTASGGHVSGISNAAPLPMEMPGASLDELNINGVHPAGLDEDIRPDRGGIGGVVK